MEPDPLQVSYSGFRPKQKPCSLHTIPDIPTWLWGYGGEGKGGGKGGGEARGWWDGRENKTKLGLLPAQNLPHKAKQFRKYIPELARGRRPSACQLLPTEHM